MKMNIEYIQIEDVLYTLCAFFLPFDLGKSSKFIVEIMFLLYKLMNARCFTWPKRAKTQFPILCMTKLQ